MSDAGLDRLRELIVERLGILPSNAHDYRLRAALGALVDATHASSPGDALAHLALQPEDAPLWQVVVQELVVGETHFFRQASWFKQLEQHVLAPLIERRRAAGNRRLRIWSAACATGEEAYTLAIIVDRLLGSRAGWDVAIAGTDVCVRFLADARRAVYREWVLREVDPDARARYFRESGGAYELVPEIRDMVSFRFGNLARAPMPGEDLDLTGIDVLVCRNVLMYLGYEQQIAVAQRLSGALAPDGWLAVAPAEATAEWFRPLVPLNVPAAIFFGRPRGAPATPSASVPPTNVTGAAAASPCGESPTEARVRPVAARAVPIAVPDEPLEAAVRAILHERALVLATPKVVATPAETVELVVFRSGEHRYALAASDVLESIALESVTRLPGVPDVHRGIISHRGTIYALIDVRPLLDVAIDGAAAPAQALLLQSDSVMIALAADAVETLALVETSAIEAGVTPEGVVVLEAWKILADARLVIDDRSLSG